MTARRRWPRVDLQDMLDGFATLERLASSPRLIVPGHDPLVRSLFPSNLSPDIFRLDMGPERDIPV